MAARKLLEQIRGHWELTASFLRDRGLPQSCGSKTQITQAFWEDRVIFRIVWGWPTVDNLINSWKYLAKSWKQIISNERKNDFNTNYSLTCATLAGKVLNKLQWYLSTHFRKIHKTACHRLMKNVRGGYHSRIISLHWLMLGECAWVW